MSETSARASRFALAFGSLARKGLIGGRAGGPSMGGGVPARSGTAATTAGARALAGGENALPGDHAGRGTPLATADGGAAGSDVGDGALGMLLRPDGGALEGADDGRGANGAAGPPIGRDVTGGAERAPALLVLAKGAMPEEEGDVLAAAEPLAPGAEIGGRMNGGATGRVPAPPVVAEAVVAAGAFVAGADVEGADVAVGASTPPVCATAATAGVAAATGMTGVVGTVAGTNGIAADVPALPTAGVANGANAPEGEGNVSDSARTRGASDGGLVGDRSADDGAGVTRASTLDAGALTAL